MIVKQVVDIKSFMSLLFKENLFDGFELRDFKIETFVSFNISGKLNIDSENSSYAKWEQVKPYAFNIIKGQKLPKAIKIVFCATSDMLAQFAGAKALFINITYIKETLMLSTGVAKDFSLSKAVDDAWDAYILGFLRDNEIIVSTSIV